MDGRAVHMTDAVLEKSGEEIDRDGIAEPNQNEDEP
jgi:hypothetical protein